MSLFLHFNQSGLSGSCVGFEQGLKREKREFREHYWEGVGIVTCEDAAFK
jgi:hypothetical protein